MPSSLRTFRLGRGDEATLVSTSAFSGALIRWYRWRPGAWEWPFFRDGTPPVTDRHQLLELPVLSLELPYLLLSGVPHRVTGQPLLARLHELLGPRVLGVGLDALPPAQVVDGDLPAEAFQHGADLLIGGVFTSGSHLHCGDERPGLLAQFLGGLCFAYF